MDMNLNKFQEIVKEREVWHVAVHGVKKSWMWLSKQQQCDVFTMPQGHMNFDI